MIDDTTRDFIKLHEKDDIRLLALQANRYPNIDMPFVLRQVKGRQIAAEKFPTWYNDEQILYPVSVSLEQSSSEKTALYKSGLCTGNIFADLTGGLGVDFSFMSRKFQNSFYVETQKELTRLAKHNFISLGLSGYKIINSDAENFLQSSPLLDTIYIDPSRRNLQGKKTVLIEDCTPNLIIMDSLLSEKSKRTIIKLSPMLDINDTLKKLKDISEVHVISSNNECKELLFIKEKKNPQNIIFRCVNILTESIDIYEFDKQKELGRPENTDRPKKYLYEPNSSIIKAGCYIGLVNTFGLKKLHPNSHLFTSDIFHNDFHGRVFLIKDVSGYTKNDIRILSKTVPKANITVRNFPDSVSEIRKKTGIKDGGEIYIFATTLSDGKKVLIICEKK